MNIIEKIEILLYNSRNMTITKIIFIKNNNNTIHIYYIVLAVPHIALPMFSCKHNTSDGKYNINYIMLCCWPINLRCFYDVQLVTLLCCGSKLLKNTILYQTILRYYAYLHMENDEVCSTNEKFSHFYHT